jgi:hypothetical protein
MGISLAPYPRHGIDGFLAGVIQTIFDEGDGLLVQHVGVEVRASRLAQQKSVQERDGNIAIIPVLAHYVFAGVLMDRAGAGTLRRSQGYAEPGQKESTQGDAAVSIHYHPPHENGRNMPMQSVSPLKVELPKVAGGGAAPARSLERLLMGAKELPNAGAQYVPLFA